MSIYGKLIKNPIIATVMSHIETYPTPINLTYLWGFGSLAGLALGSQIITGVLLAMHYASEVTLAFASVEHIMRDVKGGAVLRYIHANGASMFLLIIYLHMFRGLYFGSYFQPRANLWYSGIVIFLAMMATAFMGYVLPWGQMSFWGATVITNLFSAIPYIGDSIVQLLWGGFSVDNPTLNRFFSLHYLVPFIIAGLAFLHLILLHLPGSNNPLGISAIYDKIPFYPYFYVKDLFGFFVFVLIFSTFVIYAPNYLGHPDNYIEANPLVTPAHIVPEWYFLPFYAVLRSIPDKLGGVVLMVVAIVILAVLPIVDTSVFRSTFFKPLNLWLFWFFFANSICLGWIGQEIVETPFIETGIFVTTSYFIFFIILLPLAGFLENTILTAYTNTQHDSEDYFTHLGGNNNLLFSALNLVFVTKWLEFFQFGFLFLFLLILALFLSRRGQGSRFLNKIGFLYLIFVAFLSSLEYLEFSEALLSTDSQGGYLETSIADKFYNMDLNMFAKIFMFYSFVTIAIFFYGIADRFFISNSYEIEFTLLVFFLHTGALFLFAVNNLMEFILAIEIVTLAMYALTTFSRKNRFSVYAGVQYFILGSVPSGLLVLGLTLLYKGLGSYQYSAIELILTENLSLLSTNVKFVTLQDSQDFVSTYETMLEFYAFQFASYSIFKIELQSLGSVIVDSFQNIETYLSNILKQSVDIEKYLKDLSHFISNFTKEYSKFVQKLENSVKDEINHLENINNQEINFQSRIKKILAYSLESKNSLFSFLDLITEFLKFNSYVYQQDYLINSDLILLEKLEFQAQENNFHLELYRTSIQALLDQLENLSNESTLVKEEEDRLLELLNFELNEFYVFVDSLERDIVDFQIVWTNFFFNSQVYFNFIIDLLNYKNLILDLLFESNISILEKDILCELVNSLFIHVGNKELFMEDLFYTSIPQYLKEVDTFINLITLTSESNALLVEFTLKNLNFVQNLKELTDQRDLLTYNIVELIESVDEKLNLLATDWNSDIKNNLEISDYITLRIYPTYESQISSHSTIITDIIIFKNHVKILNLDLNFLVNTNIFYEVKLVNMIDSLEKIILNSSNEISTISFINEINSESLFFEKSFLNIEETSIESLFYEIDFLDEKTAPVLLPEQRALFDINEVDSKFKLLTENFKEVQTADILWHQKLKFQLLIFDVGLEKLVQHIEKNLYELYEFPHLDSNLLCSILDYNFLDFKSYDLILLLSVFLIFFNLLFKITAAPFHFWAPSVYGKAPLAAVTFLSIFSKAMVFFAIAKFLITIFHSFYFIFLPFLLFVSILSVLFGMLGAFAEKGIKRFFVYSSMGHVGFMLLGLSLSTREGFSATFHYLPVYIITSFIMWFTLMNLGEKKNQIVHFSRLKNSNPLLALIFSLIVFSMSGIPPLGGFFVKLDILAALLESSHFYVNYILLFFTVASFFYYLRLVKIIFFDESLESETKIDGAAEERLWIISILFIILLFYMFLVEKPLLEIQLEALTSLY